MMDTTTWHKMRGWFILCNLFLLYIWYQSNVWTPTHSRDFLYFYFFLHCRIIVKTNYEVTKNVLNKSKYFYILQSSHPLPMMTTLHTLGILSISFMRNAFPKILEFSHVEYLLAAFRVIVEACSSDAALHHSPSWSYSPYIAWRCVG
jgi:hypothetical protein